MDERPGEDQVAGARDDRSERPFRRTSGDDQRGNEDVGIEYDPHLRKSRWRSASVRTPFSFALDVQKPWTRRNSPAWRTARAARRASWITALSDLLPAEAVDALQKLCHDVLAARVGAEPRFFSTADLPLTGSKTALYALANWSKELAATARTAEHPYNPGLMLESLASRAKVALATH